MARLHRLPAGLFLAVSLLPFATVSTTAQEGWSIVDLDAITVVPSRVEETATDAPAGVSVVTGEEAAARQPVNAADLVFGLPGVTISQGPARTGSVANIRGLQDFGRVVVAVDGTRNNFYQNNHGNKTTFWVEPAFIGKTTVVRGPVSNTYGSGAIGGVVAFETLTPDEILAPGEKFATRLTKTLQTNGAGLKGTAVSAFRFNSSFDVIGGISGHSFGDYVNGDGETRVNSGDDGLAGFAKARLSGDNGEVTLSWIGDDGKWRDGGEAPTDSGYDTDLQQHTFNAKLAYANPENLWIDFRGTAYATSVEKDQHKYQGTSGVGTTRNFDLLTTGFDAQNTSRFDTGPLFHTLTYGGDWFHDDFFSSTGLFTPSGDRWAWGAYIQDRIAFPNWLELTGAVRFDTYQLDDGAGLNVSDQRLSPRLTAQVSPFAHGHPLEGFSLFATYAHGYRAPSIGETLMNGDHPAGPFDSFPLLPNPEVRPESSAGFEFGVNLARNDVFREGDGLRAKAVYFNNTVSDYIGIYEAAFGDPVPSGGVCAPTQVYFSCYFYDNVDKVDLSGFEFETEYDAGTWFGVMTASILNADYGSSGVSIENAPRDRYTASLGRRFLDKGLTLGGEVQFVGAPKQIDALSGDPDTYDAYTLVNLFASWEPRADRRFDLRVENLFDEAYGSAINAADDAALLEPGRTIKLTGTVRLGVPDSAIKRSEEPL